MSGTSPDQTPGEGARAADGPPAPAGAHAPDEPDGGADGPAVEVADPVATERDEYLDALRRLQADFDNYRKRMAKQQGELSERAAESLVARLLPVLDTVDLALAHVTGESPGGQAPGGQAPAGSEVPPPRLEGADSPRAGGSSPPAGPPQAGEAGALAQVAGALSDILGKEGLERIDPQGQPFDPNEHDAVMHEPESEGAGGGPEVIEVLRAGYRWKGRVLRPAMVKVKG